MRNLKEGVVIKKYDSLKFEYFLVGVIVTILTIALFLFSNNDTVVNAIIVTFTNTMVFVITKFYDAKIYTKNEKEKSDMDNKKI